MQDFFRILFLGDIVGRPARKFLNLHLPSIKEKHSLDLIIANGENATSGAGINLKSIKELKNSGIDIITLGDHVLDRDFISENKENANLSCVCVPCNMETAINASNFVVANKNGISVGVCVVLGRQFMKIPATCPFKRFDEMFNGYRSLVDIFIAEIHAEATSEKIAYGWYVDGRASVAVGTHTHVQTADEAILPNGTAYITDLGMCGAHKSVIGRDINAVLDSFITGHKQRLKIAEEDLRINGCIVDFDRSTKKAIKIFRFSYKV